MCGVNGANNVPGMESSVTSHTEKKLSHKAAKAAWKKAKRKQHRQEEAKARDRKIEEETAKEENSPSYRARLRFEEEKERDEEEQRERQRQLEHAMWLERERFALLEIEETKRRQEVIRKKREEEEKRIREEWEERQKKEKEAEEEKEKQEKLKKEKQDALLKEAMSSERGKRDGNWHNPLAPANYQQEAENCPFFIKTGACRFGDRCSRSHPYPESSCTLLLKGMYMHFGLMEGLQEEFDLDITLEYEDKETYHHFRDFYEDVLPEFQSYGKVVQFKVCCNYEPHLRGNVYVQFRREEDAQAAFLRFNGRWYAGRQIQCEFCSVTRWKNAICGQFRTKKCPKGKNCNFLHVFRNPGGEFWEADRDFNVNEPRSERHRSQQDSDRSHRSWLVSREGRQRATWDREGSRSSRSSRARSPSHRKTPQRPRSRSPSRSKQRRSRSPADYRRSKSPKRSRRSRSRSRSRSPRRKPSSSKSRVHTSRRPRSASKSPSRSNGAVCDTWNSDMDSEDERSVRTRRRSRSRSTTHGGYREAGRDRSPSTSPSQSRSSSPEKVSSKKRKHKKEKKHKKHKRQRSEKDSAKDREGSGERQKKEGQEKERQMERKEEQGESRERLASRDGEDRERKDDEQRERNERVMAGDGEERDTGEEGDLPPEDPYVQTSQ